MEISNGDVWSRMREDLKHLLEEAKKLNRKSKEYDDQVELINNQIEKMMEYNDNHQ